jgi:hypothetical protein
MSDTFTLRLLKLNCYVTDEADADEVFLKMNKKKIWPVREQYKSMERGALPVDVEIKDIAGNSKIELELWDYDLLSSNDLLGTFKIIADRRGGPYNTDMVLNKKSGENARYNLEWEIL